uniref:hypothetical protein n=1 Tax=Halomonas sp. TaxID=1486246 RepID=UPI002617E0B9|nr:hypothetical protein [Halomonas sp.]
MNSFAVYIPGTGEIVGMFSGSESDAALQVRKIVSCDPSFDAITHHVQDGVVTPKRALDLSHDIDGLAVTFRHLPPGLRVEVAGMETETDSEPTEIQFDVPGTYQFQFSGLVPYLNAELEITLDG